MTLVHRPSVASLLFTLLLPLPSCDAAPATQRSTTLPTVPMPIGKKTFTLEVADSDELRQKGLMRRDSLPKDHGMIFVFIDEAPRAFWMKNTRIPLDIIYLDARGKIVSIKQMKPFDLNSTPSDGPAQYAIELIQNTAKDLGIKPGDTLELPKGLKAKD
jgi:uncharacterized membrane protein (UPF0127 family)